MQALLADYGGLMMVVMFFVIIAGRTVVEFALHLKSGYGEKLHRYKKVLERLRLSAALCAISFLALTMLSQIYENGYFWPNFVWGAFCVLGLMFFNSVYDETFNTE